MISPELWNLLLVSTVAGILASLACGLGALPLLIRGLDPAKHTGLGYAMAGGLMFAASVFNLILPGLQDQTHQWSLMSTLPVLGGVLLGALFLSAADGFLTRDHSDVGQHLAASWGGKTGMLIFLAMCVHSIPEGVAVGVAFASGQENQTNLGIYVAVAIGVHNIPEGLAVAIPMRSAGASIARCFWAAFLTSLPQPIAAIPAVIAAWVFDPITPILMGFAAGSMIFLVVLELIPDALETQKPKRMAWAFTTGFCLMLLMQVMLEQWA